MTTDGDDGDDTDTEDLLVSNPNHANFNVRSSDEDEEQEEDEGGPPESDDDAEGRDSSVKGSRKESS
jgi:hypothetical protein